MKTSDLVLIGTVASIEPIFLNRWNGAEQSALRSLNDAYIQAQEHPSAEGLRSLKDKYLATFPVLDDKEKKQVQSADSVEEMASFFSSSLDRGMRIHLKVKTLFKQGDDDDDAASAKRLKKAPDFLMSGRLSATAATTSRSARPISFTRTKKKAPITFSPAPARVPSDYPTRATI